MNRRGFVSGGAALAMLAGRAFADPDDLRTAAREAWLYGLPLIEASRARVALIGDKPQAGSPGFNSFAHQRTPPGPQMRDFSAPEPDMLHSSAWICLAGGPARITVPPTGGRYFTLAIFDLYGNVLDTIDGHDASKAGHEVTLIGPPPRVGVAGYTAPAPRMPALHRMIQTASLWVRVVARTHLEGDHDLAAARALQGGLEIQVKPGRARPAPTVARDAAWNDYFYAVQALIEENPPPRDDFGFFRRIEAMQVGIGGGFEKARFADSELAAIAKGVADGVTLASQAPDSPLLGGWIYPRPDLGAYGQDFLYRAQTSLTEPAALRPAEVTSLRATTPTGSRTFSSSGRYRLALPAAPPADGLWSLTLYEASADGRLFLTENPIGRHFFGAWTPGLRRQPDGAIEIAVCRTNPDRGANWLPAPSDGPFALVLRAYAPDAAILSGRYRPPAVESI